MIEIITDMTTLWVSVMMTVLLVAAMTKANVLLIEWELRTSWKKQFIHTEVQELVNSMLIHQSSKQYKPKIPSSRDHNNEDDEEHPQNVFNDDIENMRRRFLEKKYIFINDIKFDDCPYSVWFGRESSYYG